MTNTDKDYEIVRLSKYNLKDVETLHKHVYGTTPAKNYFAKKYDTAYTGVEYVGYIAYNQQRLPIAYYGVIPCFLQNGNEIILSAQSADTMTHPLYRYKGMFVELSNTTFDLCRESGILMVFGFPNQNSFHGAVHKLGWKMTETMDCFIIPVDSMPLESVSKRFSLLNNSYKKYVNSILRIYKFDAYGVPNSVLTDGYAGIYRNDQYLQYKLYSDTQVIRIGESKIWVKISNGLVVGDIDAVDETNFHQVIDKLKGLVRKIGVRKIVFHSCPGPQLHTLFSRQSQRVPSFPVLFQDFGAGIPLEKIKFTFADIDVF